MATNNDYTSMEYFDESSIDSNLICSICQKPFKEPVCTSCDHTYCKECITRWLTKNKTPSCPTCMKQPLLVNKLTQASRPLRNMLDQLRVHCKLCEETNLQRGNFIDHINKICQKATVQCQAADIRCPWKGPREELKEHVSKCIFEPLRPVLGFLITENSQLKKQIQQQAYEFKKLQGKPSQVTMDTATTANDSDTESITSSTSEIPMDDTNQKEDNAIFVKNLPNNVKFNDVFDFFSKVGRIKYDSRSQKACVFIFKNQTNTNAPCSAKVVYVDKESASAAVGEYDKKHIPQWNVQLQVCISQPKKSHFKDDSKFNRERGQSKATGDKPSNEQDTTSKNNNNRTRPHHSKQTN